VIKNFCISRLFQKHSGLPTGHKNATETSHVKTFIHIKYNAHLSDVEKSFQQKYNFLKTVSVHSRKAKLEKRTQ